MLGLTPIRYVFTLPPSGRSLTSPAVVQSADFAPEHSQVVDSAENGPALANFTLINRAHKSKWAHPWGQNAVGEIRMLRRAL